MSFWFEYLEAQVNPNFIRKVAELPSDDDIRLVMASMVCSIVSGVRIPAKAYKTEYAKRLIIKGKSVREVANMAKITERQVYRLKRVINGQS